MAARFTHILVLLIFVSACGPLERGTTTPFGHDLHHNLPPNLLHACPPEANSITWYRPLDATPCLDSLPPGIQEVRSGGHFIATPHANLWTIKTQPHRVNLCEVPKGLSAAHSALSKAFQILTGKPLPNVIIHLFPIYEDSRSGQSRFVTDNASYDPEQSRITLFPSSNNQPGKVHLWTAPFIHAHEMAHHAIDSFRKMKRVRSFSNANDDEPFADVLGFLALGSKPEFIRELPGFGVDRDPSSPFFSDGTPKEMRKIEQDLDRKAAVRAHLMWKQLSPDDLVRVLLNAQLSPR